MKEFAVQTLIAADASVQQLGIATNTEFMVAVSAQGVFTGAPTGTLKLQASNDKLLGSALATNWSDIPGSTIAVTAAATYLLPKIDVCYSRVRAVYVPTSGTGTVSVMIKTLGF